MKPITKKRITCFPLGGAAKCRMTICISLLVLLAISSCEQRDPQAEYEALRDAVYTNPRAGIDAAQEYIDYFYKKKGGRINEVSEIRHQYRAMDDFFSQTFNSYSDYVKRGSSIYRELSSSNYEGVRKAWSILYKRELDRLLGPLMDSITKDTFDAFFKTQVKWLCENQYRTWDVESVDRITLTTPTLVNDGTAKEASGEYRVHLRGNIIGFRTSIARISIEGVIGPNAAGQIDYVRTGYQFLEEPFL